ncbi:hypothetical protein MVEG_00138 [Podila verticillata NRRL 6337]|nr:hypothetical protein MVEG_00138 [Podila verticillata NRRL 6337]
MKNRLFVSADTGARTLGFFCAWRDSTSLGCFTHTFLPGWGSFRIHVHRNEDNYVCSIRIDSSDDTKKYTEFKSCSLRVHEGNWLVSNTIQLQPIHTIDQHLTAVQKSLLVPANGKFIIEFRLSTALVSAPPLKSVPPPRTIAETILDKIYRESAHGDVVFIFDQPATSLSATQEPDITQDSVADTDMDFGTSLDYQGDQDEQSQWTQTQEKQNKIHQSQDCNKSTPAVARTQASAVSLRAHKLVLCQWPYFKAMFEGGFAESGPGEKRIPIKDVKQSAFQLMLKFLYVGKLPRDINSMVVCADELVDEKKSSLEDLFLVGHRYDVQELCSQVAEKILSRLDASNCIPFLYRSAYMFHDLRGPVIKIVAEKCGDQIAKRSIRDSYKDHPDFVDILGELFEQHHALHDK